MGNVGDAGAGVCDSMFVIQSGNAPGCTRLAAEIFSCPGYCDLSCFPCIHKGSACSSINELAAMPPIGGKALSVLGAGTEAGLSAEYLPDGVLSTCSARSGRIQLGNVPSSLRSEPKKLDAPAFPAADVAGRSPERSVSNHAGSSDCSGAAIP